MSFLDLTTSAAVRKSEMEARIEIFKRKCATAQNNLQILSCRADGFLETLNCEQLELRDRFLASMKHLDEFIYLVTDFNLGISKLDTIPMENRPEQDLHNSWKPLTPTAVSLLDVLSEPQPSTSGTCMNKACSGPKKVNRRHSPKADLLIEFSSSTESLDTALCLNQVEKASIVEQSIVAQSEVPNLKNIETKVLQEHQNNKFPLQRSEKVVKQEVKNLQRQGPENKPLHEEKLPQTKAMYVPEFRAFDMPKAEAFNLSIQSSMNLPRQDTLQTDQSYPCAIVHVDGSAFYIITEKVTLLDEMHAAMCDYYYDNHVDPSAELVNSLTYCALYDEASCMWLRCLVTNHQENDVELFRVDFGDVRSVPRRLVQPLGEQFFTLPPFARSCHLAGVDLKVGDMDCSELVGQYMQEYIGATCSVIVEDNSSESLGVYLVLESKEVMNNLLVDMNLAVLSGGAPVWPKKEKLGESAPSEVQHTNSNVKPTRNGERAPKNDSRHNTSDGSPAINGLQPTVNAEEDPFSITDCPEYEDALDAVQGYRNRDEADCCRHYKGGPDKTCFKGSMCKKKHIMLHPGGWTLDRVDVPAHMHPPELPPLGVIIKVRVSHVAHYNIIYVHIVPPHGEVKHKQQFGVRVPPRSLSELVADMNSKGACALYRPLTSVPAIGEMVASLYPVDDQWYRGRVTEIDFNDNSVEIMYVDYGNRCWVLASSVRQLDMAYMTLPLQAVCCRLAGIRPMLNVIDVYTKAKIALSDLILNKCLEATVVSTSYDEIEIDLLDSEGFRVVDLLAAHNLVTLDEVKVNTAEPKNNILLA